MFKNIIILSGCLALAGCFVGRTGVDDDVLGPDAEVQPAGQDQGGPGGGNLDDIPGSGSDNPVDDPIDETPVDDVVNLAPVVTIDSPLSGATFGARPSFTVTISADDPDGTVAQVILYDGDEEVGVADAEPYTFTMLGVATGAHELRAVAIDDDGDIGESAPTTLIVGRVLLVTNDQPFLGDDAIVSFLESLDYEVATVTHDQVVFDDADGMSLVFVSETSLSGEVSDTFRDLPIGVLSAEPNIYDDLGMTADLGTDHGYTANRNNVLIEDDEHPLAAGLTGIVTVYDPPENETGTMSWGVPAPTATVIAWEPEVPEHAVIFTYDAGDPMVNFDAPARRTGFFLFGTGDEPLFTNADGWKLLQAAVEWTSRSSP